jgi:hypothetical protein
MSLPTTPPPTEPDPYRRPDFGSALLILVGLVLLLPGLCAIISAFAMSEMVARDPASLVPFGLLWLVCGLISWGGIALIRRATGRAKSKAGGA